MTDLGALLGYAIVALILVAPVVILLLVMRTRWFKRGHRIRWAGERLTYWRDPMNDLPKEFGEEPPSRSKRSPPTKG